LEWNFRQNSKVVRRGTQTRFGGICTARKVARGQRHEVSTLTTLELRLVMADDFGRELNEEEMSALRAGLHASLSYPQGARGKYEAFILELDVPGANGS